VYSRQQQEKHDEGDEGSMRSRNERRKKSRKRRGAYETIAVQEQHKQPAVIERGLLLLRLKCLRYIFSSILRRI